MTARDFDREIAASPAEHERVCECGGRESSHEVTDLFGHVRCTCKPDWMGGCKCKQFKEAK